MLRAASCRTGVDSVLVDSLICMGRLKYIAPSPETVRDVPNERVEAYVHSLPVGNEEESKYPDRIYAEITALTYM